MEDKVFILEITSGICCILTAIFLHYSAIPKGSNKKNYQKGYNLVKLASLILGIAALTFAITGGPTQIYGKSNFIHLILPVETLLIFWVFIYPIYEKRKTKKLPQASSLLHIITLFSQCYLHICSPWRARRVVLLYISILLRNTICLLYNYLYTHHKNLAKRENLGNRQLKEISSPYMGVGFHNMYNGNHSRNFSKPYLLADIHLMLHHILYFIRHTVS